MQTCSSCGSSFSGYGSTCHACKTRETIKDEGEKNRRLSESIARDASAAAQRQASMQREQMERMAYQQQRIAAQQQEMAEQQIQIENQKLNELQKQTRLLEEQAVSIEEAFDDGYQIRHLNAKKFLTNSDTNFYFDNPYITSKLNKAYLEGVSEKINDVFNDEKVWITPLLARIEEMATSKRELLLKLEDAINNDVNRLTYQVVFIEVNQIYIDFGIIELDLSIIVNEDTGEASFAKTNFFKITKNKLINEKFSLHFNCEEVLNYINQNKKKLRRLELILSNKIIQFSSFLKQQKKNNDTVTFNNLRCILGYLTVVYGLYILFTLDYSIFNAVPAIFVWGIAAFLAGNNWSVESGYNMSEGNDTLDKLKTFLKQIQTELDLNLINKNSSEVLINTNIKENLILPINKKKSFSTLLKFLLLVGAIFCSFGLVYYLKPEILPNSILTTFPVNLPIDVKSFIDQKESCDHFLNEPPFDAERKKFLNENIKKFCIGSDLKLEDLRKKYSINKIISNKLSNYSSIGIVETGPALVQSYEEQRKKFLSTGWKPWKFSQVNNFSGQFPEVMTCYEGFCDSYFINKAGKSILNITYKICGSDYVGICSGYANEFLMIEHYETISIDEAKRQNKIAKDRFE